MEVTLATLYKRRSRDGTYIWYVLYREGDKSRMRSTSTSDKALAQEVMKRIEEDALRVTHGLEPVETVKPILLSEFLELYLEERQRIKVAQNTLLADRIALKQLMDFIGDCSMQSISERMVRDFRSARGKAVKSVSVNHALRHLKSAFSWAVDGAPQKYLLNNPFKQKNLFLRDQEERLPRCLSPNEKSALFEVMGDSVFKPLFQFLLLTGCRRNEALDLTWDDIDLERFQVIFRRTKSKKSRIVPINIELMHVVMALDRNKQRPFPFKSHHVSHVFKKYARLAGLKEDIHLHCLRHTAASDLVRTGIPPFQIQKLLGHSSIRVTEVYVHVSPEDLRTAAERLTCFG
jgi:integrase